MCNPCVISDRSIHMPTLIATHQPFAAKDAENETREKLVIAAENLFALHGYQKVTVRAIAAAAGVNWSLLGYYFRGKEGLLFEVYRRHCNALNAERFQLLKAARAGARPPQLEKVLEAFVLPALSIAETQAGGASFSRLRAVLAAEDSKLLDQLVTENFDSSSGEFIDALCECLPELSRDEVLWRFHFMLGTIYYTASGPHRIKVFSEGRCDPANVSENLKHLIPFLAAGFRSPATSVSQYQTQPSTASAGKKTRPARDRVRR
jgi:AcrR family transcriptional regulator